MADSEEQRSLISRFVAVSGVSEERAKFFLESASWNLEVCYCFGRRFLRWLSGRWRVVFERM